VACLIGVGQIRAYDRGLAVRCDWGPQYIADAWIQEVKWLGITISPSYVGKPECNDYASHCTSLRPWGTRSLDRIRLESFTPWALFGACVVGGS